MPWLGGSSCSPSSSAQRRPYWSGIVPHPQYGSGPLGMITSAVAGSIRAGTIDESLIEVIEFGLPYPPAVGEHELIQMPRFQRANAVSIASASSLKLWERARSNIRRSRGK